MEPSIQSQHLRIQAKQSGDSWYLFFEVMQGSAGWRTILVSGLAAPANIWTTNTTFLCEDPLLEWLEDGRLQHAQGFFHDVNLVEDYKLVLSGSAGGHLVREEIEIIDQDHVHVYILDELSEPGMEIGQLMTHLYFAPDLKANRTFEPLEFAWLPALHKQQDHVCADHFFRSPAAAVYADSVYAALVPDLDILSRNRIAPHALDLRTTETLIEAPRLSYGICPSQRDGHVYFRHSPTNFATLTATSLSYGFDLFYGFAGCSADVTHRITDFLWQRYGHPNFQDVRPQVIPFDVYGQKYTYVHELASSIRKVEINGQKCVGIDNQHRRGANFHAWENDLHVSYGIRHYGDAWNRPDLQQTADEIRNLILQAPINQGAFPCIYNFEQQCYEGTLFWTARSADPYRGYDSAAMSVSAWWLLAWYEDFEQDADIYSRVLAYADFLMQQQLHSGAIPTYYASNLQPTKQLLQSATTAISGAVLAKAASMSGRIDLRDAALWAGHYVQEQIVPELNFNDFEAYYSCSPKPLHAIDYWTGIRPHNNLSIQWACDQFLALYKLTGDDAWRETGEYLLSILSLYQQIWSPPYFSEYLFGGFGVMNTDAEWNDGRQARFVSTYADYYLGTGKIEYLERAVAACRASFALMDIPENHANRINAIIMQRSMGGSHEPEHMQPGLGYAPENSQHGENIARQSWTGLDWSSGGALSASAYLDRRFGAVWADGASRVVVPINGVAVDLISWNEDTINLTISSALKALPAPYLQSRQVLLKFGMLGERMKSWTVIINQESKLACTVDAMEKGILVNI